MLEQEEFADVGLLDPLAQGSRAASLTSDSAWLQALVETELALSRALVAGGLAPEWMLEVCDELEDSTALNLAQIARQARGGGNPVIPLVKHLGRAAEKLHAGGSDHLHVGATSQDIFDTAAMLIGRRVLDEVQRGLTEFTGRLADLAEQHAGTVMVGRTLGQQAVPTSFGFVAAGWLAGALAATERIAALRGRLPLQYGGAVGNLAVLTDVARRRRPDADPQEIVQTVARDLAGRLGLVVPDLAWHADRVPVVELAAALGTAVGVAGSFARDITVLSRTEIAEVTERLGEGEGGSSAMPHKRNPVSAVLIVGGARRAPALVGTLFGSMLAEDQRPSGAWHAEWAALRDLERLCIAATTAAASLAGRLEVDTEQMMANLELTDGQVFSERVSTLLAETLGKKEAFDLVGRASAEAFSTHRPLQVVISGSLAADGENPQLRAEVWNAFQPENALGAAGAAIERVLQRYRTVMTDLERTATP